MITTNKADMCPINMDLRVTGFPSNVKYCKFEHALEMLDISWSPAIRFPVNTKLVRFGTFLAILFASMDSIILPDKNRLLRRTNLGKLSSRTIILSARSTASYRSRVVAKCSIAGIARPLNSISLSPSALERCSADDIISAESLMVSSIYNVAY